MKKLTSILLLFGLCLLPRIASASVDDLGDFSGYDTEPSIEETELSWFLRPKKETPREQMWYANKLRLGGRLKKSCKAYRALVAAWPFSFEAVAAQYAQGMVLQERGKHFKAFDAYQRLIDDYTGRFPYERILQHQLDIALHLMETPKGKFLLFPGFESPERAIPLLETIVKNGPNWHDAPRAQYLIGQAFESIRNYEEAIPAYTLTEERYSDHAAAAEAGMGKIRCLKALSDESQNSIAMANRVWVAMSIYLTQYPGSVYADEISSFQEGIYARRANAAYEKARFYDKLAERPEAALEQYREFLIQYADSSWTETVQDRIILLSKKVEQTAKVNRDTSEE